MGKRKSVRKVETEEVQGKDSFVVVSSVKIAEVRAIRKLDKDPEFDKFEGGLKMLTDHILEWNWVDDDDVPLPQVKDDPSVIDQLTNEETEFLAELLMGSKN